ncbi:hypothetical protein BDV93DRAFT_525961 [Ceratobasidium sp. AG-I]|nr:hypothetical protein BDV93DRAFT_525961 [Ceratobasidium sp. AG-I]
MTCASISSAIVPTCPSDSSTAPAGPDQLRAPPKPRFSRPAARLLHQPPPPPLGPPNVFASAWFKDYTRRSPAVTPEHEVNMICPIAERFKSPIDVEVYFPSVPGGSAGR